MSYKHTPDIHYKNMLKVRLKGTTSVVLNGSITGRTYIFKAKGDMNWVDKRDINDFKTYEDLVIVS